MAFKDITNEFKRTVKEHEGPVPDAKRRKVASHKPSKAEEEQIALNKNYVAEAYNILNHIQTLTRMLASVRTAYLNVDARSAPHGRSGLGSGSRTFDLSGDGSQASSWSNVKYLTNEERDQIDLQARVILTRCADRVKEMEALEKRRADLIARATNPLTRLLPARLRQDESTLSSDVVAAHHSGITWFLSRRLAEASQTQKELQEERVKRQLERTKSLGAGAAQEAMMMHSRSGSGSGSGSRHRKEPSSAAGESSPSRGPGGWLESTIAATIGAAPSSASSSHDRKPTSATTYSPALSAYVSSDSDDDELELSASQILQFEQENANILKTVQDTLESVQQAESRLMDISALQMELVTHLTRQTELTDQLYEDAIMTTSTVEKGNEQLKEAKRRAKDSRLFLLVFLIGASLSLLFLHYY